MRLGRRQDRVAGLSRASLDAALTEDITNRAEGFEIQKPLVAKGMSSHARCRFRTSDILLVRQALYR